MSNIIIHKRNSTPGAIPQTTNIHQGELAINIADGKLFTKNISNNIINLGVTSISGTYITPNSGNFTDSLTLNNNTVWHSGNFDNNNIVRSTGYQDIYGQKFFSDGINVGPTNIFGSTGIISTSSTTTLLTIPFAPSGAYNFIIQLSAYNATNSGVASWNIRGLINRIGTGNCTLIGDRIVEKWVDSIFSSSTVSVVASSTNMLIQATAFPTSNTNIKMSICYT